MKRENKNLIYFFGNFTFICLTLLGLFFLYEGFVVGFLKREMLSCIAHLIYGATATAAGLIGLGYIREWWRDER